MDQKEINLQRNCDEFVHREVYYCVSSLVHELAQNEKYMDDLMQVCIADDWESAGQDNGIEVREDPDCAGSWQYSTEDSGKESETWKPEEDENEEDRPNPWKDLKADSELEAWREACEEENIEPQQREAYEHWIVSSYLAEKLEEKGEMITHDFLGLTIWGRTCTGQAISMDYVIRTIYKEGPGQYDKE
jgi:hypothetical protein